MTWPKNISNLLMAFGLLETFAPIYITLPTDLVAGIFFLGLCIRIFVLFKRINSKEELDKEYVFWRNALIFSFIPWFIMWFSLAMGASKFANSYGGLFYLSVFLVLLCLVGSYSFREQGNMKVAIDLVALPLILLASTVLFVNVLVAHDIIVLRT